MKRACAFAAFLATALSLGADWSLPPAVPLTARPAAAKSDYAVPTLRLWGWSREGRLAWSTERPIEGRGGLEVVLQVQDLVTDEILWTLSEDSNDWDSYDAGRDGPEESFAYERNRPAISAALSRFGIQAGTGADLGPGGASEGAFRFTFAAESVPETRPTERDALKSYAVTAARSDGRKKVVTRAASPQALSVAVWGAFRSPWEPRVAVLYGESRFVFEGSETYFMMTGCDLKARF